MAFANLVLLTQMRKDLKSKAKESNAEYFSGVLPTGSSDYQTEVIKIPYLGMNGTEIVDVEILPLSVDIGEVNPEIQPGLKHSSKRRKLHNDVAFGDLIEIE